MYQFSGLIICLECGKRFRGKLERSKRIYICSGYSNYGKDFCERNQIEEADLIYLVEKHLFITKKEVGEGKTLRDYVKSIELSDKNKTIEIKYNDKTFTLISPARQIY